MSRATIGVLVILWASCGASTRAGEGDPPPSPPVQLPAMAVPPLPSGSLASPAASEPPPSLGPSGAGPVLAVPGLPDLRPSVAVSPRPAENTTPSGIPLASPAPGTLAGEPTGLGSPPPLVEPDAPGSEPSDLGGPPPLVGPADLGGEGPITSPLPAPRYSTTPPPGIGRPGLTLKPVEPGGRAPQQGRPTGPNSTARPTDRAQDRWSTPPPPPPPRRRLFGVIPLPSLAGRPAPADRVPPPAWSDLDLDRRDPESELEANPDIMVERRLRAQIRSALGGSLHALDVRVVDKEVTIRAHASRFWQKRGIRRSLEAMPMPAGYRARVVVD